MTVDFNRNADLHLADVLSEQLAMMRPSELLAEAAEDFGDQGELAKEFDKAFACAVAQDRRWRIAGLLQEFAAAVLTPSPWKLAGAAVATLVVVVVGGAHYLVDRSKEPTTELAEAESRSAIQDRELDALQARIDAIERAGDLSAADASAKQYLVLAKGRYGEEHPKYVNALNSLAGVYRAKGDYQAAEPLYKRAISIVEKALGPDHPSVATALNNLVLLYDSEGRYGEAEPLLKRSLVIWEKAGGPGSPEVAMGRKRLEELREQLAQSHDATAEREKAERMAEELRRQTAERERVERLAEERRIAQSHEAAGKQIWSVGSGRTLAVLSGLTDPVESCAFSPDGRSLATASKGNVRVWDVRSTYAVSEFNVYVTPITAMTFGPDGREIFVVSGDTVIAAQDVTDSRLVFSSYRSKILSVRPTSDGVFVITGSDDNAAKLFKNGQEIRAFRGHEGRVTSAASSAYGKLMLTAANDQTMRIWDVPTGEQRAVLRAPGGGSAFGAFSLDGLRVVSFNRQDSSAFVWDSASGHLLTRFMGHTARVTHAAFSPDGQRVITTSEDGTARVWNTSIGNMIATLEGHSGPVTSAAFSPDGELVATTSSDRTVRIWRVSPDHK